MKKAIILFSGGLDSTTCLAIAKAEAFDCYALTFHYGQKHHAEVVAATKLAALYGVKDHKVIQIPVGVITGSSLTDEALAVPDFTGNGNIPNTYVPARNTIFLSFAVGYAEVVGATDIFIGANFLDYSGYPDCRPDFLNAFEVVANLGTKAGAEGSRFKIHAPLLKLRKHEIIAEGIKLGVDYAKTVSCYRLNNKGEACGKCDSCEYRKIGFSEAGVVDPTVYQSV